MAEHLGAPTPRALARWQLGKGIDQMMSYLTEALNTAKLGCEGFHVLWFGGLQDSTREDYNRSTYVEKLYASLQGIREHERALSVTWCTLPESAHNAEAAFINEEVVRLAATADWLKVLDLRYISRREGTMELNETIWTQKGSQCVFESLKRFLCEKLEYTASELKAIDESAKRAREKREKRDKKEVSKRPAAQTAGPRTASGQATGGQAKQHNGTHVAVKKFPPVEVMSKTPAVKQKNAVKTGGAQQQRHKAPRQPQASSAVQAARQKAQQKPQWHQGSSQQHNKQLSKRGFPQDSWGGYQQESNGGQQHKRFRYSAEATYNYPSSYDYADYTGGQYY